MEKDEQIQMSFDLFNSTQEVVIKKNNNTIRKVQYIATEEFDYKKLFQGFERLKVITFSYDLNFINEISNYFNEIEVIFGCSALINNDLNYIMAQQKYDIEEIRKYKNLVEKVKKKEIKFYVSEQRISHSKIYILDNFDENNSNNRVISGSSNFSRRGMSGIQMEDNVLFENDSNAYLDYLSEYEELKSLASNNMIKSAMIINENEIEIEDLPIVKSVLNTDTTLIVENAEDIKEKEFKIITDQYSGIFENYKFDINKKDQYKFIKPNKLKLLIARDKRTKNNIKTLTNEFKTSFFEFDLENNRVKYNQQEMNLETDKEKVISDINLLKKYMNGFNNAIIKGKHYNVLSLQKEYFKMLNYMFASPFISMLRYNSYLATGNNTMGLNYPLFAVVNGYKNAGKTTFLSNIYKFMTNSTITLLPGDAFTTTKMKSIIENHQGGIFLVFDEISKDRFRNYKDYTKECDKLPSFGIKNHPCFLITSNTINSIDSDILKRVILFDIYGQFDQDEVFNNLKEYNKLTSSITNSFYMEYLKRMMPIVKTSLNDMIENNEFIDIFKTSSKVIIDILNDYNIDIPDYMTVISRIDLIGEKTSASRALEKIKNAWENDKEHITINKKENIIVYEGDDIYSLKAIYNELPTKVNGVLTGNKLVMNKKELEFYLEKELKFSFFEKIKYSK